MAQVSKRALAFSDLADIWFFIADDSEYQADKFMDLIDGKLSLPATQPRMGRERPELGAALRSFPIGRYVVFYRPVHGGLEVLRVLHSARDIGPEEFADTP